MGKNAAAGRWRRVAVAARYTFFRTPTGEPYKGRDGKHTPANLLADIGKKARLIPEGGLQWEGFFLEHFLVALQSSLVVIGTDDQELNEHDVIPIVSEALDDVVKRKPGQGVNPLDLLKRADESAAAFFRKPLEKYVLVSSLSLGSPGSPR
jgi:hypothetical protein